MASHKPLTPLSDAQRELAGRPEHVAFAHAVAARLARPVPWLVEDFKADALFGLVRAARNYDPAQGVAFTTFAEPHVCGAVRDAARDLMPKGFRRGPRLRVLSLSRRPQRRGDSHRAAPTLAELIPSDHLPVGWEAESEDAVEAVARKLPPRHAEAVRAYFLSAGLQMKDMGDQMGVSESRVSQLIGEAGAMIRGETSAPHEPEPYRPRSKVAVPIRDMLRIEPMSCRALSHAMGRHYGTVFYVLRDCPWFEATDGPASAALWRLTTLGEDSE